MKLYEFKDAMWGGFFVIVYFSVFIYGILWLNKAYDLDDKILEARRLMTYDFEQQMKARDDEDLIRDIELKRHEEMLQYLQKVVK